MSLAGEEEPIKMDHLEPDPLLQPGAFIDPNPTSNGNSEPKPKPKPKAKARPKPEPVSDPSGSAGTPVKTTHSSDQVGGSGTSSGDGSELARPDWLPPGWTLVERTRSSGASAGSKDKYYSDPVSKRRFRSKKEVLYFLEHGTPMSKKKNATTDGDSESQGNTPTPKRKKSEPKGKELSIKNFKFDDIPTKVKWELTDVYMGTWRPLINGVERVPETAKQEWSAAFTYLTLQQNGDNAQF